MVVRFFKQKAIKRGLSPIEVPLNF